MSIFFALVLFILLISLYLSLTRRVTYSGPAILTTPLKFIRGGYARFMGWRDMKLGLVLISAADPSAQGWRFAVTIALGPWMVNGSLYIRPKK